MDGYMRPHKPELYVAGKPCAVMLVNDDGIEHQDWLWQELDPCTTDQLSHAIADMLCQANVDAAVSGYRMIKAVEVYNDWWSRTAERG